MHGEIRFIMGVLGAIAAYLAVDLLHLLYTNDDAGVTLNVETSRHVDHARLMLGAEVVLILASLLFLLGGYYEIHLLLDAGELLFAGLTLVPVLIFRSWRRWLR